MIWFIFLFNAMGQNHSLYVLKAKVHESTITETNVEAPPKWRGFQKKILYAFQFFNESVLKFLLSAL